MGPGVTTILDVFSLDLEHISNCAGEHKIIAAILEAPAIEKILTHLGCRGREHRPVLPASQDGAEP